MWQTEELALAVEEGEVAAPGVDADALKSNALGLHLAQGAQDLVIQVWQVPEDVAVEGQLWGLKAGELAQVNALAVEGGQDGAAAGGTEVNGEKVHGELRVES